VTQHLGGVHVHPKEWVTSVGLARSIVSEKKPCPAAADPVKETGVLYDYLQASAAVPNVFSAASSHGARRSCAGEFQ
jgi:hypothetical protein